MGAEPAGRRSPQRHQARLASLAFVRHEEEVLLLRHPEVSDRFAGRWNGIGGHVEAGEDIRAAALRELREEVGLDAVRLRLRGVIHESGLLGQSYVVFLFVGESPSRAVRPASGVELAWFRLGELESLPLVEDLEELLPRLLAAREPVFVTETYDGGDGRLAISISDEEGCGG